MTSSCLVDNSIETNGIKKAKICFPLYIQSTFAPISMNYILMLKTLGMHYMAAVAILVPCDWDEILVTTDI